MSSQFNTAFNVSANKIVSMKEWHQKTKANFKQSLSFKEKAFLRLIEGPTAAVVSLGSAFKKRSSSLAGLYVDANYKFYVSGAALQEIAANKKYFTLNKKFQSKRNSLTEKAFADCEDHSKKVATNQLKPL